MIKKGKNIIRSHMTLNYKFSGTRIQDGFLIPVDWDLSVDLLAISKKNKEKEEIEILAGLTYQKIYFWLDTNLQNIVIVNTNNESDLYIANLSSNIMMYCPGKSSDDIIIQLLHSKLSLLASPDLIVSEMRLKGSDTALEYTFDSDDGNYELPEITSEYYKEGVAKDIYPWWKRNDGFCFEFIRPLDDDGNVILGDEVFSEIVDPLVEFYKLVEEADSRVSLMKEPARIVQVEKWKPKKVE